ncbi:MAG: DUF3040 domain-containing protein [Rhodoluna sp.]
MGLSEHEQKLLEEMERGLYASDSSLAHKIGKPGALSPKRIVAGLALAVIGLSLLIVAVMVRFIAFGVVGFLLMLIGLAVTGGAGIGKAAGKAGISGKAGPAGKSGDKSNYFEARWDRRTGQ